MEWCIGGGGVGNKFIYLSRRAGKKPTNSPPDGTAAAAKREETVAARRRRLDDSTAWIGTMDQSLRRALHLQTATTSSAYQCMTSGGPFPLLSYSHLYTNPVYSG